MACRGHAMGIMSVMSTLFSTWVMKTNGKGKFGLRTP